jgi:hypothetical protein
MSNLNRNIEVADIRCYKTEIGFFPSNPLACILIPEGVLQKNTPQCKRTRKEIWQVLCIRSFHYSRWNRRPLSKLSKLTSKRCIEREKAVTELNKEYLRNNSFMLLFNLVHYSAKCPLV